MANENLENLITEFKFAEKEFERAVKALEIFKHAHPLYKEARIQRTCPCTKIKFILLEAAQEFLHAPTDRFGAAFGNEITPDMFSSFFPDAVCSKYETQYGTLINKVDQKASDDLEDQLIAEYTELKASIGPLIMRVQERIYRLLLEQGGLSFKATQDLLNEKAACEEAITISYDKLVALQQSISDLLLGYLRLDALPVGRRDNIPAYISGVYLLWNSGSLDYIGQSENIKQRLGSGHHIFDKEKHLITVVRIKDSKERDEIEKWLIQKLHPARNVTNNLLQQTINRVMFDKDDLSGV